MSNDYKKEIVAPLTPEAAVLEASRCLLCHDAPCSKSCPAGTNPAKFIRSLRFLNPRGAAETIRENNALGSLCARVCPTEKYCQKGCLRSGIDRPIDIGGIQRYLTDFEMESGMEILKPGKDNGKSIGIIGSGPAALQAAASLRVKGYAVTIYEAKEKVGGYLRYGIPEYRLPTNILDYEINRIAKLGVTLVTSTKVGVDVSYEEVENRHDAIIAAIGYSKGRLLPMFGRGQNVRVAVDLLKDIRDGKFVDVPSSALVIGGGDVAMDAITSLKLMGVSKVIDVAYEELTEFRASKNELRDALAHADSIIAGYEPIAYDGKIVVFKHRHLNSELTIEADLIVLATGQMPDAGTLPLEFERGEVKGPSPYRTNNPKLYYAGDIAHNDKSVVGAVRTGKEVAEYIDIYVGRGN